jgi:ribosome-associated translation inhibitor RaiA
MIPVEVHADRRVPRRELEQARRALASLDRYVARPLLGARLTLRRTHAAKPFVADATILLDGRLIAAHSEGRSATEAASDAVARLRRQLLRATKAPVAERNDPRRLGAAAARRREPRFVELWRQGGDAPREQA